MRRSTEERRAARLAHLSGWQLVKHMDHLAKLDEKRQRSWVAVCPTCKAERGSPCICRDGGERASCHQARVDAAQRSPLDGLSVGHIKPWDGPAEELRTAAHIAAQRAKAA
jgi:hypothetical protein